MTSERASLIQLSNLHVRYGAVHAVNGLSLTVNEGDVLFVIGPSGCGKSSLLRSINLLETPSEGTIRVGDDLQMFGASQSMHKGHRLARYRSQFGMVFQQFDLFPHLAVLENITEGPRTVLKKSRLEATRIAEDLLAKVGLTDKAAMYPAQLSGGQAQRVAIARALAMSPRVLLLDEITSALDPELVSEVLAVVRQLASEGITMILVTHEIAFARDVATKVIMMEQGRIVEEGSAEEVLTRPTNERTRAFLSRFHGERPIGANA